MPRIHGDKGAFRKMTPEEFDAAFLDAVVPVPFSGCHLWTRGALASGYGEMGRKTMHRYAWEREHGPIPKGMHVLHKCDVPSCVNPAHLFLGSQRDNNIDRDRKGRSRGGSLPGAKHPMAKLTEEEVARIRAMYADGMSQTAIGRAFGVAQPTVSEIVRRVRWHA